MMAGVAVVFALGGFLLLRQGSAATSVIVREAEAGMLAGNAATAGSQSGASGGSAVRFAPVLTGTPTFQASELASGLWHPWDLAFLSATDFVFTQRDGTFSLYRNGAISKINGMNDVTADGEGGLMGLAADPQFAGNRYLYACFFTQGSDIRVGRWKLSTDMVNLSDRRDIVTGIKAYPTGWHAGCRIAFGPDGYLWITTGDAAMAGTSQDLKGLAGKVLRVDRDGNAAPGNLGGTADARIYSYGHRNVQGIAFFPSPKNGVPGLTSEHGPTVDDEINELRKGNFGWNRTDPNNDTGNMTDTSQWPDAILPIWKSGNPTQAPSGMEIINSPLWKSWNGAAAIAMQKTKHLKILSLDANNKVTKEEKVLDGTYGRLRTVRQGPDGSLYILTDNASNDDFNTKVDKIIKLTPN